MDEENSPAGPAGSTGPAGGGTDPGAGEQQWWFCLRHMTVEPDDGCPGKDRLGPYPSADAAARALETVRERNEQWDAQDE